MSLLANSKIPNAQSQRKLFPINYNLLSTIYASCLVVLLFSNSRILLRTIVPVSGLAETIGVLIAFVFCVSVLLMIVLKKYHINKYAVFFICFATLTMARFSWAGMSWKVVIPDIITWAGVVGIIVFGKKEAFIRLILKAFTITMLLHLFVIVAPFEFVQRGLDITTAYGISHPHHGAGILTGRNTGFLSSPGVLSLYSVVGLMVGIVLFCSERRFIWGLLSVVSFLCGILSVSRSFVLGMIVIVIILPFFLAKVRIYMLALSVLIVGGVIASNYTIYGNRMIERFAVETLQRDVETRLNGEAGFFKCVKAVAVNPFIGSMKYNSFYDRPLIFAGESEGYVQAHNGFVNIFATRGVVLGMVFLVWTVFACCRLWQTSTNDDVPATYRILCRALLAGFIAGHAVCLVDSLIESFVMLIPLSVGVINMVRKPQHFSHKAWNGRSSNIPERSCVS